MIFLSALSAVAMVGAFLPFLSVLAAPEMIQDRGLLASAYDLLGFSSRFDFLIALGFAALFVILISGFFQIIQSYVVSNFTTLRVHSFSVRLLTTYLNQPYEFFLGRHSGEMSTQILSETQQAVDRFLRPSIDLIASSITVLAILALVLLIEPEIAVFALAAFGLAYGSIFLLSQKLLGRIGSERIVANRARFKIIGEAFGGIKYLKLAGLEAETASRFSVPSEAYARSLALGAVLASTPHYAMQAFVFAGGIVFCLALLDPEYLTTGKGLGALIPTIGLFAAAAVRILPELGKAYQALAALKTSGPAVNALCDDLEQQRPVSPSLGQGAIALEKSLVLKNVTYRYPDSANHGITDVSLSVRAGEIIGIVGTTGAGKTTLADVILGLLEPQSGSMFVDGREITGDNVRRWQKNIAYVPQEIVLTDASVARNIALGREEREIDLDRVRAVAEVACIDDFVAGLPDGYQTKLGERGNRLSGGQRQRLGLARALYGACDFILLDEATSALDPLTESRVIGRIQTMTKRKTILMIAHRLSTLRDCDRIIMLDRGSVLNAGHWDSLLKDQNFRKIVDASSIA
jgi:ABC-type multidrug transport system fused ATPase/permease subunit